MRERRRFVCRLAGGAVAAALAGLLFAPAQAQKPPAKKDPAARAEEPWPDAGRLAERRVEAENLPLFGSAEPLAFTLTADFRAINRDRDPKSTTRYPGVLQLPGEGGGAQSVPVQLSARGHARRNRAVCAVVPLRLEFAKADLKGTVFRGQRELKLVTHCDNDDDHEQYVLTEYLAYRLYRLFTPNSFRTRLAKVTYVDPARNRPATRYGILLENDEDVARRMEGRLYPITSRQFRFLDRESVISMTLLQFMIGNTDYSIMALHNVELVHNRAGATYPIGYDFDYSGLVNARYAAVDPRLGIKSVRDRLYRGPCLTVGELDPLRATIAAKKDEAMAIIDAVPGLRSTRRTDVREYLSEFFSLMASPSRAKRTLIDSCRPAPGM